MSQALLHVTMDPKDTLSEDDFHDWYNNEHGPSRLCLPFFTAGMRYHAHPNTICSPSPTWLALYSLKDIRWLERPEYLRLRSPPIKSRREIDVMAQITIVRQAFELVAEEPVSQAMDLDDAAIVELSFNIAEDVDSADQGRKALQALIEAGAPPFCERMRCFTSLYGFLVLFSVDTSMLNDKRLHSALSSRLNTFARTAPSVSSKMRFWKPYYRFGPAPRHLSLYSGRWIHRGTRTVSARLSTTGIASIESSVELRDGLRIPYRLEGSCSPDAPVLCLVNSVMVDWNIWDELIEDMQSRSQITEQYRILRFALRGRFAASEYPPSEWPKVTIDLLVEDILDLLRALLIPHVRCIMGVSLGGATALRAAILHPTIFPTYIACDTNTVSPSESAKLWAERLAIADEEAACVVTANGIEPVVGEKLAEATVKRWAAPLSWDEPAVADRLQRVKAGVAMNSLDGFRHQVQALYRYDFLKGLQESKAKGCFVVGSEDGKLPDTMRTMASQSGTGSILHIVQGAGHLPMVEKPTEVCKIVVNFLAET